MVVRRNKAYGYPRWFHTFTAFFEVLTALLLIIGIWNHDLALIAGFLVVATMIGTIFTHIKMNDRFKNMVFPILPLVFGGIVVRKNFSVLFS